MIESNGRVQREIKRLITEINNNLSELDVEIIRHQPFSLMIGKTSPDVRYSIYERIDTAEEVISFLRKISRRKK